MASRASATAAEMSPDGLRGPGVPFLPSFPASPSFKIALPP